MWVCASQTVHILLTNSKDFQVYFFPYFLSYKLVLLHYYNLQPKLSDM